MKPFDNGFGSHPRGLWQPRLRKVVVGDVDRRDVSSFKTGSVMGYDSRDREILSKGNLMSQPNELSELRHLIQR